MILNILGNEVLYKENINAKNFKFEISELEEGMYLVKVSSISGVGSRRLIIRHN